MANSNQIGFREDILGTVFNITGKIWLRFTGVYLIQTLVTIVLIFGGLFAFGLFNLLNQFGTISDPTELLNTYKNIGENLISSPNFIAFVVIAIVLMILFSAWSYNFGFILADSQIKNESISFKDGFMKSFSQHVFRIALVIILLMIISVSGIGIGALASKISGFFTFLLILLWLIFMFRFLLVLPAFVIGKMSISDSFGYSFKHITNLRALKLFGVFILFFLAALVAGIIMGLLSALFALIPVLGEAVQLAIQIIIGGYMMALSLVALSGLYYRFADDLHEKEDIDIDNLLIND